MSAHGGSNVTRAPKSSWGLLPSLLTVTVFVFFGVSTIFAASQPPGPPQILSQEDRQKVAAFYKGKTIDVVTHTDPGSPTDAMLRTFIKYLPQYIPGNPQIGRITYMRGGGGLVAGNYIWERAPRDGTTLGQTSFLQVRQFERHKAVRFDVRRLNWIGNFLPQRHNIFYTRAGIGLDTIGDLLKAKRINMGAPDVGHTLYIQLRLPMYFMGLPINIIPGYTSPETTLAIQRGELDGRAWDGRSFLNELEADYAAGKLKVHWSSEPTRFEPIRDLPTFFEVIEKYGKSPSELEMRVLRLIPILTRYARYFLMPPGVPRERVLAVREGVYRTIRDMAFQTEFEKLTGWPVEYTDGDKLLHEFTDLVDAPEEAVELFKLLAGPRILPRR